jgi:hypothetical protein
MSRSRLLFAIALALTVVAPAYADQASCQKTLVTGLKKYKKTYLKTYLKCLDAENVAKITDLSVCVLSKITTTRDKVNLKIAAACAAPGDIDNYAANCDFEPGAQGKEAQCASLSVSNATELAQCLECWKAAELSEFLATLYASHAVELCGTLDETSPNCSDLDCTTPLPDQHDLGDTGENDCQRAIGKVGIKYLLTREKVLEKCGLAGGNSTTCFDNMDPNGVKVLAALAKAEGKKIAGIKKKCGNRDPIASPQFCCRTGTGNNCTAAATRDDCTMVVGGDVMEGKFCDVDSTCKPAHAITWWENCPESDTCPGTALASIDDVIDCIDTSADAIVDELLCLQLPTKWPCPAGDPGTTTSTTTTTDTTTTT